MILSSLIGIIADDLTGANDTALQFHLRGSNKDFPFVRIKCVCAEDNILDEKSLKEGTTLFFDEISLLSLTGTSFS